MVRLDNRDDLLDGLEEILHRHIFDIGHLPAITATMQTVQRATQRAFPENIGQFMILRRTVPIHIEQPESESLLQRNLFRIIHIHSLFNQPPT